MAALRHIIGISVVAGLSAALSGCATIHKWTGPSEGEPAEMASAPAPEMADATGSANQSMTVAALDPLNAPVPNSATTAPASSDPMLVPAPNANAGTGSSSQRVPFGALGAPAPTQPVPLTPPAPSPKPVAEFQPAPLAPAATPAIAPPAPTPAPQVVVQSQPQMAPPPVVVERPTTNVTSQPAQIPTQFMIAPKSRPSADEETVVITSATKPPPQAREFIPASVMPDPPKSALGPGDMALTTGQKNVVQRFQTLRRLQDEALITEEEFNRRRNANIGALLPYTRDPSGAGLERSVPSADAISARLAALRRSFELRAITAQQHALERTMILNALLPEVPEDRASRQPPPRDVLEGAAMVGYLEALRTDKLISSNEFEGEKAAIDQVLKTGLLPSQTLAKAGDARKAAPAAQTASVKPAAAVEADPMTTEITGPVVHLASFSSEASARRGWDEVMSHNKAILTGVKPIIRKVDLGEKGIFFRLMAGSYTSMSAAEAACIQLKQNNQFCRASADGG